MTGETIELIIEDSSFKCIVDGKDYNTLDRLERCRIYNRLDKCTKAILVELVKEQLKNEEHNGKEI